MKPRFFPLLILCLLPAAAQQTSAPVSSVSGTVVVVGNPDPVTLGEAPRSVVMDTGEQPLAFETAEDYLRTAPLTFIEQRGASGAQADISIRGSSFEQTLVLLNGRRIDDAQTAHHNLDLPASVEAMKNFEVLHGFLWYCSACCEPRWRAAASGPVAESDSQIWGASNFNISKGVRNLISALNHTNKGWDMPSRNRTLQFLALVLAFASVLTASAAPPDHWVGTWSAAPVSVNNSDAKFGAADTTYREVVHVSLGGNRVHIILSNEFGTDSLKIAAAHVALSAGKGDVDLSTSAALTFGGKECITIPPGALAISDPTDLRLPAFADLAVSLFIPAQPMQHISIHTFADQTSYSVAGNAVSAARLDSPKEIDSWPFLKGVDVYASGKAASIVAFGDSITDGANSTRDANARWPDVLARRLQADKETASLSVLNEGINGNCILHDVAGPSGLARFDRDVIAQAGVKYLIIMESINDIGHATSPVNSYDVITADDLIQAFVQLAERAHSHGIKVIGATLTPYSGAKYASPAGEAIRQAANQWIRTSKQLDGFIDFDKATQDPTNPTSFSAGAGSSDHLHPGDSGYKIMGNAVDLKLFTK